MMVRRVLFAVIGLIVMVMINGCAKIPYQETAFDSQSKALVYVYRPSSTRVEGSIYNVAVNGIVVGRLYDAAYIPVEIETEDTTLDVVNRDTVKSFIESGTVELKNVKAGDVYYVKVNVGRQEGSLSVKLMDNEKAKKEIINTGYAHDQGFKHFKLYKSNTNTAVKPMKAVVEEPIPVESPKPHSASTPQPEYAAPAPVPAAATKAPAVKPIAADRIEKLHNLKEKGAITEDEYQTLKAKVLAE